LTKATGTAEREAAEEMIVRDSLGARRLTPTRRAVEVDTRRALDDRA